MYLVWNLGCYGATRLILEHCQRLKMRGHEVYLGTKEIGQNYDWFEADVDIPIVPIDSVPVDVAVATWYRTVFWLDEVRCQKRAYLIQADDRICFGGDRDRVEESFRLPMDVYLTMSEAIKKLIQLYYNRSPILIERRVNRRHFFREPTLKHDRKVILLEGSLSFPIFKMRETIDAAKELDADIWVTTYSDNVDFDESGVARFWHLPTQNLLREIYSSANVLLKTMFGITNSPLEALVCGTGSVLSLLWNEEWPGTDHQSGISVVDYENFSEMHKVAEQRLSQDIIIDQTIINRLTNWAGPISLLEESLGG